MNACYYADQNLLSSCLLLKGNIEKQKTIILPFFFVWISHVRGRAHVEII
jgi:hypothetical protein